MRKIKEVLRLRFGLGLQQDQIARSCSIGQATVHRYLEKAAAAKVTWPLPDDFDDRRLNELLFPARPLCTPSEPRPGLDLGAATLERRSRRGRGGAGPVRCGIASRHRSLLRGRWREVERWPRPSPRSSACRSAPCDL